MLLHGRVALARYARLRQAPDVYLDQPQPQDLVIGQAPMILVMAVIDVRRCEEHDEGCPPRRRPTP